MRNVVLVLEYEGTDFHGFCIQPGKVTVQGEIEKVLKKITGEDIRISGASRTDAGVHAWGQTVNFKTKSKLPVIELKKALNALLPRQIGIVDIKDVPVSFHARKAAKRKLYVYEIFNGEYFPLALRSYAWHIRQKLNIKLMRKAAAEFIGRKDFRSFVCEAKDKENCVRSIYSLLIKEEKVSLPLARANKYNVISLEFIGSGFLYKMVRSIVGTLVEAGLGKLGESEIEKIIKAKDRRKAKATAPAKGLHLVKINY